MPCNHCHFRLRADYYRYLIPRKQPSFKYADSGFCSGSAFRGGCNDADTDTADGPEFGPHSEPLRAVQNRPAIHLPLPVGNELRGHDTRPGVSESNFRYREIIETDAGSTRIFFERSHCGIREENITTIFRRRAIVNPNHIPGEPSRRIRGRGILALSRFTAEPGEMITRIDDLEMTYNNGWGRPLIHIVYR